MLKNYFKTIFRNLIKYKVNSFINITGLTIGFAACIIITTYILKELNYDQHFKDSDLIFRVVTDVHDQAGTLEYATSPSLLAPALKNEYPQVKYAARLITDPELRIRANEKSFVENRIFHVDPDFFNIFSFEFVHGDPATCLNQPNSVVITDEIAKKYFGESNPLGKILDFGYSVFKITGVVHIRNNSHLKYNFLLSFKPFESRISQVNGWTNIDGQTNLAYTYVKLEKNCNVRLFESQIKKISQQRLTELNIKGTAQLHSLQSIENIHLNSARLNELDKPGNKDSINIVSAIALFILIVACLNYIILTTSRFSIRDKEVGIRKTFGALRSQLIKQFLFESLLFGLIAFIIAIGLVEISLPLFNSLLGITLEFEVMSGFTLLMFVGIVIVNISAGIYPAFFLSAIPSCKSFKDNFTGYLPGTSFRNILVIFQFAVSIVLIAGTLVIYKQINFMKNLDFGFDRDKLLVLPVPLGSLFDNNSEEFISSEFKKIPSIVSASSTSFIPGMDKNMFKGRFKLEGREIQNIDLNILMADHDFLETYGIRLLSGRDFQKDRSNDLGRSCLISESALKMLNWNSPEDALGKYLFDFDQREIIGVVRDFHYRPLQHKIEPLFIAINPDFFIYLTLKFNSKNISETIRLIKDTWLRLFPNEPFEYHFFSDIFGAQYKTEENFNNIILVFSGLAIFIACLGLYGLILFNSERKTKEIGIRKALGASISQIVSMFSKDLIIWILIANVIAWPVSYYFMNKWLEDFAYRIEITWWMFALAGGIALVIALATVSFQAIKAATANPVESLRYE